MISVRVSPPFITVTSLEVTAQRLHRSIVVHQNFVEHCGAHGDGASWGCTAGGKEIKVSSALAPLKFSI